MTLRPEEIRSRTFSVALRGYSREEVSSFLSQVAADYASAIAAIAQAGRQAAEMTERAQAHLRQALGVEAEVIASLEQSLRELAVLQSRITSVNTAAGDKEVPSPRVGDDPVQGRADRGPNEVTRRWAEHDLGRL